MLPLSGCDNVALILQLSHAADLLGAKVSYSYALLNKGREYADQSSARVAAAAEVAVRQVALDALISRPVRGE